MEQNDVANTEESTRTYTPIYSIQYIYMCVCRERESEREDNKTQVGLIRVGQKKSGGKKNKGRKFKSEQDRRGKQFKIKQEAKNWE